jgi:hypothetical protein
MDINSPEVKRVGQYSIVIKYIKTVCKFKAELRLNDNPILVFHAKTHKEIDLAIRDLMEDLHDINDSSSRYDLSIEGFDL